MQYGDGRLLDLLTGLAFEVSTLPHDSWVIGDTPYVSLHVLIYINTKRPRDTYGP
ncbi:MAG: hypothetical protein ABIY37_17280 [Devosia sp.]